jgi:SPP1 family predicted phage head-tail adaptor
MRAGALNRRVRIEKRQAAQDESGGPADAWVELATVWASILFLNGREFATSGSEASAASASIRVRWRTDVDATMRVIHGGRIFNVQAVLPDEACHEHVDLACSTGLNGG